MRTFVLATENEDKTREISALLGGTFDLIPRPADIGEVEETGSTLEDNARIKATAIVKATHQPAIADDTGLEVEALSGAPGVFSARFAGEHASYAANVAKLLSALDGVPEPRLARFRTIAIAVFPDGEEVIAEGAVAGSIATTPRGSNGFGYDPIFVPDVSNGRTFAELTPDEKNRISHRALAFRALSQLLSG
jgi:XTP/dITP diphosphohydrolase